MLPCYFLYFMNKNIKNDYIKCASTIDRYFIHRMYEERYKK
jgi:hypothetical protein